MSALLLSKAEVCALVKPHVPLPALLETARCCRGKMEALPESRRATAIAIFRMDDIIMLLYDSGSPSLLNVVEMGAVVTDYLSTDPGDGRIEKLKRCVYVQTGMRPSFVTCHVERMK